MERATLPGVQQPQRPPQKQLMPLQAGPLSSLRTAENEQMRKQVRRAGRADAGGERRLRRLGPAQRGGVEVLEA
eukprot:217240-Alexandrium_andersonii.AAC.1